MRYGALEGYLGTWGARARLMANPNLVPTGEPDPQPLDLSSPKIILRSYLNPWENLNINFGFLIGSLYKSLNLLFLGSWGTEEGHPHIMALKGFFLAAVSESVSGFEGLLLVRSWVCAPVDVEGMVQLVYHRYKRNP